MKRMITAATLTLACISTITTTLVSTSLRSPAYAAEQPCELTASPAATGGDIQQHIDVIAHCNTRDRSTMMMETSYTTPNTKVTQINANPVKQDSIDDANRAFCPSIPLGASAEDFQYRVALERCKFGAGS